MKKLYAIRNKKTGELLDRWNSFENNAKIAKAGLADSGSYEIVTLRIEPTEPCEFCRDPDDLIVARYKPRKPGDPDPMMVAVEALDPELCPMCGRKIGRAHV